MMEIVLAAWQGVRCIASAIIGNWQTVATLAILAVPSIGLHLLKRKS